MVVDVWMQHPTPRLLAQEVFASLWRWTGQKPPEEKASHRSHRSLALPFEIVISTRSRASERY